MNIKKITSKIKTAWRRWVSFLPAKLGYISIAEHKREVERLEMRNADISRLAAKCEIDNSNLRSAMKKMPFDFDRLLRYYNPAKLNALVYRIINDTRNNPETIEYLLRWRERIDNALATLPNGKEELRD